MLPPKIKLTDQILHNIKTARTAKRIPAASLSRAINRDDSYISSLELKRLRTISSADLVAILCTLFSISEHEAILKAVEFIGTGTTVSNYPDQKVYTPLAGDGGEDTMRVREPTVAGYGSIAITDYTELELINDMLDTLTGFIAEFYKKDPKEAVFVLNSFIKAVQLDPAFAIGVMGLPFYLLKSLSADKRMAVLTDLASVITSAQQRREPE